jgi:hypothetical protein
MIDLQLPISDALAPSARDAFGIKGGIFGGCAPGVKTPGYCRKPLRGSQSGLERTVDSPFGTADLKICSSSDALAVGPVRVSRLAGSPNLRLLDRLRFLRDFKTF